MLHRYLRWWEGLGNNLVSWTSSLLFVLVYKDLRGFEGLRSKPHRWFLGSYDPGEYFSQGALKIEGRCQIVSAQRMIGQGLYHIRSEFEDFAHWERREKPPWAEPVIEIRESFYCNKAERERISAEKLQAALSIAQLFEPRWKLPMAASFIALAAPQNNDESIILTFRANTFTGTIVSGLSKVHRRGLDVL
jgi:hypothetical protein